jgi:hypothetical protein
MGSVDTAAVTAAIATRAGRSPGKGESGDGDQ